MWGFVLSGQLSDQLPQGPGSTGRMNVAQTLRDPAARPENIQMKLRVPVLRADSFPGDGRAAFRPARIPGLRVGRWKGPGLTAAGDQGCLQYRVWVGDEWDAVPAAGRGAGPGDPPGWAQLLPRNLDQAHPSCPRLPSPLKQRRV